MTWIIATTGPIHFSSFQTMSTRIRNMTNFKDSMHIIISSQSGVTIFFPFSSCFFFPVLAINLCATWKYVLQTKTSPLKLILGHDEIKWKEKKKWLFFFFGALWTITSIGQTGMHLQTWIIKRNDWFGVVVVVVPVVEKKNTTFFFFSYEEKIYSENIMQSCVCVCEIYSILFDFHFWNWHIINS